MRRQFIFWACTVDRRGHFADGEWFLCAKKKRFDDFRQRHKNAKHVIPIPLARERDLTYGDRSRNEGWVSIASNERSFPVRLRARALRSGLRLFLQGGGACPELVEGLRMTRCFCMPV